MTAQHPELVFLAGPQKGQIVALKKSPSIVGRGADADVLLSEEFASRKHFRYEASHDGPVVENLSEKGTWINGKRYKSGKQIILETGDVIGVGTDTQLLFVAAGDDAGTAVATFRETVAASGKNAFGKVAQDAPTPAPRDMPPVPDDTDEPAPFRPVVLSPGDEAATEKRRRKRKITIGLAIYGILILGLVVALSVRRGKAPGNSQPMPAELKERQISDALAAPLAGIQPNPLTAAQKLETALGLYRQSDSGQGKQLYTVLRAFKEARAYSGQPFFAEPAHDLIYNKVLDGFTRYFIDAYRNACLAEMSHQWFEAEVKFNQLLNIVEDETMLRDNLQKHFWRVKSIREKNAADQRAKPWA